MMRETVQIWSHSAKQQLHPEGILEIYLSRFKYEKEHEMC